VHALGMYGWSTPESSTREHRDQATAEQRAHVDDLPPSRTVGVRAVDDAQRVAARRGDPACRAGTRAAATPAGTTSAPSINTGGAVDDRARRHGAFGQRELGAQCRVTSACDGRAPQSHSCVPTHAKSSTTPMRTRGASRARR
jgi:hypothetical protein